jgi:DNA-binding NarL/FixJ family response regulator
MNAVTVETARPGSIVIVDDHGLLAQSLSFALSADGFGVERCTDLTADGILAVVEAANAEVVLLDLDIGGELGTTLPLIPEVVAQGAKVVMLTGVRDRARLAECVEAGAIGIIAKSEPFDDLVEGIRRAAMNGSLLTPGERDAYLADLRRKRAAEQARLRDFEELTPREAQVLAALMDGRSADQIAVDWVVSITTVRSQIRSLLQKLGVNSQLSAVALARKAGWTQTGS